MASNKYSVTGKADLSQHDKAFQKSALEVRKYQKQISDARKDVQNFQRNTANLSSSFSQLSAAFSSGNIGSFATQLSSLGPVIGTLTSGFAGLGTAINVALGPIGLIAAGIGAVVGVGYSAAKSVSEFEVHLDELQSLTGLDDMGMNAVSESAVEMSKKFGKSASDIVDSMKLIGGQRPELLSNAAALASVTDSALVLSQAGKISVEDAAKAISTTLNQMGLSADETTGVINVLAAAAQAGSADISALNVMFTKSGSSAKTAGLSYQELAAISETIAPKFGSADVAGTALTGTLTKLTSQANNEFNPAVVGMRQALDNLAAAELSEAQIKQLVGESNMTAIKTMIESRDEYSRLTGVMNEASKAVGESGIAFQQAATNTDNVEGAVARLKSTWSATLIQIGESSAIQMLIDMFKDLLSGVGAIIEVMGDLFSSVYRLIAAIAEATGIMKTLKVILAVVGGAFYIVTEAVSVVINIIAKVIQYIVMLRDKAFKALANWIKSTPIFQPIIDACKKVIEWFKNLIKSIVSIWNKFKEWLGQDVKDIDTDVDVKINKQIETKQIDTSTDTAPTTTPNVPEIKSQTLKYESGSIKDLEQKISNINNLLQTSANLSDEQISSYRKQKSELESQLKTLKKRAGLENTETVSFEVGSIKDLENQISRINNLLQTSANLSDEQISAYQRQKTELESHVKVLKQRTGLEAPTFETGSIKDLEQKISNINNLLQTSANLSAEQIAAYQAQKTELQNQLDLLKQRIGLQVTPKIETGSLADVENQLSQKQAEIKTVVVGSERFNVLATEIAELTKKQQSIKLAVDTAQIDEATAKMNTLQATAQRNNEVFQSLGTIFSGLGDAIGGVAGQLMSFAGQFATQTGQMLMQLAQIVVANQAAATAKGIESAAGLMFPFNLAAIATVVGTISSLFAALPKFAQGGFVGGGSFIGDSTLIRANAGELVLNTREQQKMWSLLNSNGNNKNNAQTSGQVNFRISGKDLVGVLQTQQNKTNRIR